MVCIWDIWDIYTGGKRLQGLQDGRIISELVKGRDVWNGGQRVELEEGHDRTSQCHG